MIMHLNYGLLQ